MKTIHRLVVLPALVIMIVLYLSCGYGQDVKVKGFQQAYSAQKKTLDPVSSVKNLDDPDQSDDESRIADSDTSEGIHR